LAVRDDTGQAVASARVTLTSTTPPFSAQTGTADAHGLFVGTVGVGIPYSYHVSASAHDDAAGTYTAQDQSVQTLPITLPGATILFTAGGVTGSSVALPTLSGQSSVTLAYQASAQLSPETLQSQVTVTAQYTYSQSVPTLSLSENRFVVSTGLGLAGTRHLT